MLLAIGELSPIDILKLPIFSDLLAGILEELEKYKMTFIFEYSSTKRPVPEMLDKRFCDGVLILSLGENKIHSNLKSKLKGIPCVFCLKKHPDIANQGKVITYNNRIVGELAANYMKSKNHKYVVFFNSEPQHSAYMEREKVFINSCTKLNINADIISIPSKLRHPENKYELLAEQFIQLKTKPTGAFFCADHCMIGVILALSKYNFSDSSIDILGCNYETRYLSLLNPTPSSINIQINKIGKIAVRELLERINDRKNKERNKDIILSPEIILSNTTCKTYNSAIKGYKINLK